MSKVTNVIIKGKHIHSIKLSLAALYDIYPLTRYFSIIPPFDAIKFIIVTTPLMCSNIVCMLACEAK